MAGRKELHRLRFKNSWIEWGISWECNTLCILARSLIPLHRARLINIDCWVCDLLGLSSQGIPKIDVLDNERPWEEGKRSDFNNGTYNSGAAQSQTRTSLANETKRLGFNKTRPSHCHKRLLEKRKQFIHLHDAILNQKPRRLPKHRRTCWPKGEVRKLWIFIADYVKQ